jgi:hypothetical protein
MPPCALGVACLAAYRKISFDRRKLGALECEFRTKREGFADTRAVGCEALASLSQPMPIILLLALEMRERMLEARDGASCVRRSSCRSRSSRRRRRCRHLSGDVLLDLADASGRKLDLTLRVADLPTNSLWSSTCAARRRSSRAISASRPAFCIRRGSPDAIAFAMANWFA